MKEATLDKYDINILTVLQKEGRISKRELADRINLSTTPCWTRMQNLEKRGYISGYHADINYDRLGKYFYLTSLVSLSSHRASDRRRFQQLVMEIPEIIECDEVMGEVDYILKFLVSSIDHHKEVFERLLESDVEIVRHHSHVRSRSIKRKSDNSFSNLRECANNS